MGVWPCFEAKWYCTSAFIKDSAFDVIGSSCCPVASKLARLIGLKGKLKSAFVFKRQRGR
jgi:hypothetical protein